MDPAFQTNPTALTDSLSESTPLTTERIPVIEEQLSVGKRIVETGRVVISKQVTERQETVDIPLNRDEVQVERVLINRYVDSPPAAVRHEGDTMIISVLEEVVVVEKRLMLVEELHVTKRQLQTQETQQVTLRREDVTVTRQPGTVSDGDPTESTN